MEQSSKVRLESWVNEYGDSLYTWAAYKLKDDDLARDMVQDTFLAAWQAWDRFEGKSAVKTWLISILNNKIRDHFRKNKNRLFSLEDLSGERSVDDFFDQNGSWKEEYRPALLNDDDKHLLDQPEFREAMYRCLNGLSDRFRVVIVGKFLETRDSTELCQELGISATNFWQILHRAKMQLRTCLDKGWFKQHP